MSDPSRSRRPTSASTAGSSPASSSAWPSSSSSSSSPSASPPAATSPLLSPFQLPPSAVVPAISIPQVSKDIQEIVHHHHPEPEADCEEGGLISGFNQVHVEFGGKEYNRISCPARGGGGTMSNSQDSRGGFGGGGGGFNGDQAGVPEVSHLGWGHWHTLRELERCTGRLDDRNVTREGGYGIVYYGVPDDGLQIAVKNLLNNR